MKIFTSLKLLAGNVVEVLLRRFAHRSIPAPEAISKVLLIKRYGIGNAVMFIPALRELRRHFPHAHITVYATRATHRLLDGSGLHDESRLDPDDLIGSGSAEDIMATIEKIREDHYDLAILSFPSNRTHVRQILQMSRASLVVGHNVWGRARIFDRTLPYEDGRHEVEANLDLLRAAGLKVGRADITLGLTHRELTDAAREFNRLGLSDYPVTISIHMGILPAKMNKVWAQENYTAVAKAAMSRLGAGVLIVGGSEERNSCDALTDELGAGAVSVAGLGIRETAGLLSCCSLHLGGDTGLTHLARSVGVPVAVVFGPTDPRRCRPWGNSSEVRVVRTGIDCSPCMQFGFRRKRSCGLECLRELTVSRVEHELLDFANSIGVSKQQRPG